ncbi:MAG TPA: methyltransferase domain-containing protein [Candidatus Polarisedimenticolia bacterium]
MGAPARRPDPERDLIERRLLSSLYLRGAVPLRRLERLSAGRGGATDLDDALARLRREGMVARQGGRVRLTPLGEKVAYRFACQEARPLAALLDDVGEELPSSGRMLDLGCGPGGYLAEAAARGPVAAFGLDRDPEALSIAAASLREEGLVAPLVRAEAERLPFAAGVFDSVLCVVVLPYVREERVLREAARVLRPGGRLIVSGHGPGYYARLAAGRGMTWRRRLFGLISIAGTLSHRAFGLRLPGARYQRTRGIASTLASCGVRVTGQHRRGRFCGLAERVRLVAVKGGEGGAA